MNIGTCGWSYLPKKFVQPGESRLIAYAKRFDVVEINSTFYHLPKTSTARAWRKEVDKVNTKFEFTVKVPKLISHVSNFTDMDTWEKIRDIGESLKAKYMVFQTPESFQPTPVNIKKMTNFFGSIKGFDFAIEARGWEQKVIDKVFPKIGLIQIVDPFSQDPRKQKINYYRLHGKGEIMYRYRFKEEDLEFLKSKMKKGYYIMFNNIFMYDDSMRLKELIKGV